MPAMYISELESKVLTLVKEAHKRKKKAKKSNIKHYFEGQNDAFEQVLMELKNLRYELEVHIDDVDDEIEEAVVVEVEEAVVVEVEEAVAAEVEEAVAVEVEEAVVKKTRKKRKRAKAPQIQKPEEEALLKEAIAQGVITQKSSHYYNEIFPGGKIQGKIKILEALEQEDIRQKIQGQFAQ